MSERLSSSVIGEPYQRPQCNEAAETCGHEFLHQLKVRTGGVSLVLHGVRIVKISGLIVLYLDAMGMF